MNELVDDLLDVSRVTRGLVSIEKTELDIKDVIHSAIEQARPLIDSRKHRLALHLPPDHPLVLGDRTRLIQVITNLLNNASKYTPLGGHIDLCLEVKDPCVCISIADNGIGMDAQLLPHVFDLFTQAERTPGPFPGRPRAWPCAGPEHHDPAWRQRHCEQRRARQGQHLELVAAFAQHGTRGRRPVRAKRG